MKEKIKQLLEYGVLAPSGDNCQPWHFKVGPDSIRIFNLPQKDTSLYNIQQRASIVAHGALIENLLIASTTLDLALEIEPFPEGEQSNQVALVHVSEKAGQSPDPLFPFLRKRNTNRRVFEKKSLDETQREAILHACDPIEMTAVRVSPNEAEKDSLAQIICQNDRLVFENRRLHDFLFDHIRWSPEEAEQTRDGMDFRSFELGAMDRFAFRGLKNWNLVKAANAFGVLSRKVTGQAETQCRSASAIGVVTTSDDSLAGFLQGGRSMQRVWLEATRQGLQLQPMAGLAFLIYRVARGETKELAPKHVATIQNIHEQLKSAFNLQDETMIMLFRVGVAEPPSAESLRRPIDQVAEFTD